MIGVSLGTIVVILKTPYILKLIKEKLLDKLNKQVERAMEKEQIKAELEKILNENATLEKIVNQLKNEKTMSNNGLQSRIVSAQKERENTSEQREQSEGRRSGRLHQEIMISGH